MHRHASPWIAATLLIGLAACGPDAAANRSGRAADRAITPAQPGLIPPDAEVGTVPAPADPAIPAFTVELPRQDPAPSLVDLATHPALRGRLRSDAPDNTAAWRDILAYLRDESGGGGFTLRIPPGTYRFLVDAGQPLVIAGLHDATIDGQGAEFRFSHADHANLWQSAMLAVRGCERVRVAGLTLDWDWDDRPLASFASVAAVAPDQSEVRLRVADPTPRRQAAFAAAGERYMDLQPWDAGRGGIGVAWVNELPIGGDASRILGKTFAGPGRWEGGELVLPVQPAARAWIARFMPVGAAYAVRHYVYETAGLSLKDNVHLTIEDVAIRSCPGIGIHISGRQHHTALRRVRIAPRPGTFASRPFTAAADGLHVSSSQGRLLLEDCVIRGNADDGVNLHDNIHRGIVVGSDPRQVSLVRFRGLTPFAAGDEVEFRGPDFRPSALPFRTRLATVAISGVPGTPERRADLVLADPLPAALAASAAGVCVLNRAYDSGSCIIRRCEIGGNKGRGLLIEVPRVLVEGCRIADNRKHAVDLGIELTSAWGEGYGPDDITIRGCVLDNTNIETVWLPHRRSPALRVGAVIGDYNRREDELRWGVARRILIDGNAFRGIPGVALELVAGADVMVRGNTFQNLGRRPAEGRPGGGAVVVAGGGAVAVRGNTWIAGRGLRQPGVLIDDGADPAQVAVSGNRLSADGAADELLTLTAPHPADPAGAAAWDLVVPVPLGPDGGTIVLEDPVGGRFAASTVDTRADAAGWREIRIPVALPAGDDVAVRVRIPPPGAVLDRCRLADLAAGRAMAPRLEPR